MNTTRLRKLSALLAGLALCMPLPGLAQADAYPAKPITIVVGYPPGGSTDLTGRVLRKGLDLLGIGTVERM